MRLFFLFLVFTTLYYSSYSQIEVSGKIIDMETGTELEGVKVILKKKVVSGGGYFTGVLTTENGQFNVSTNFKYPLELIISKIGCTNIKVPIERKKNYYTIELQCEKEFIEKIIIEKEKKETSITKNFDIIANPDFIGTQLEASDNQITYENNLEGYNKDKAIVFFEKMLLFNDSIIRNDDKTLVNENKNIIDNKIIINILDSAKYGRIQKKEGLYEYIFDNDIKTFTDTIQYSLSYENSSDTSYLIFVKNEDDYSYPPKNVEINPIYYDFNKSEIRDDAMEELDKIIKLMNDYPDMIIELRSYADCRGSEKYNLELSEKRAMNAARYIQKGINSASEELLKLFDDRVIGKGYGESEPKSDCSLDCSSCRESEHQSNRRTEFVVDFKEKILN